MQRKVERNEHPLRNIARPEVLGNLVGDHEARMISLIASCDKLGEDIRRLLVGVSFTDSKPGSLNHS